jgi:hypothetical protein
MIATAATVFILLTTYSGKTGELRHDPPSVWPSHERCETMGGVTTKFYKDLPGYSAYFRCIEIPQSSLNQWFPDTPKHKQECEDLKRKEQGTRSSGNAGVDAGLWTAYRQSEAISGCLTGVQQPPQIPEPPRSTTTCIPLLPGGIENGYSCTTR